MTEIDSAAAAAAVASRLANRFLPGGPFAASLLKRPASVDQPWVFRCTPKGPGSPVISKLGPQTDAGRAQLRGQFDRLTAASQLLTGPIFRTPMPLAFCPEDAALLMEDAAGPSILQVVKGCADPAEAAGAMAQAGRWLSAFHRATGFAAPFEPRPHLRSLKAKLRAAPDAIAHRPAFRARLDALAARADALRGCTGVRCITHRDFHLQNLILGHDGRVFGIDFENAKPDDALRDVGFFLQDFACRWSHLPDPMPAVRQVARDFWQAYDDRGTPADLVDFFLRLMALDGWSRLTPERLQSPARRHKLGVLRALSDEPLLP